MGSDLLSFRGDPDRSGASWLGVALLATLLASVCCVLPLALVLLGISGAWLTALPRWQPLSPLLSIASWIALALAAWQIYRRGPACEADACRYPRLRRIIRRVFPMVCLLAALPLALSLFAEQFYGG